MPEHTVRERTYNLKEAASFLGISVGQMRLRMEFIPYVDTNPGGHYRKPRFAESDLIAYLENASVDPGRITTR